jgi:hypothetical protein
MAHNDDVNTALEELEAARYVHAAAVRRLLEAVATAMVRGGATDDDVRASLDAIAGPALRPDLARSRGVHVAALTELAAGQLKH